MPSVQQRASILNQEENENDESNDRIEMSDMGDAENVVIQLPPTGTDKQDKSVESDRVTYKTFIGLIIGIILHLWDVGSDIYLAYDYLSQGRILFSVLTIFFVFVPTIITMIISYRMDKKNKQSNDKQKFPPPVWKQNAWIKVPIFLLLLTPLFYAGNNIKYAYKSLKFEKIKNEDKQQRYYKRMNYENEEFALLKIFDVFFEAAPQQILQLTILLSNPDKSALPSWIQIVSVCSSFCSIAWTITSYHCNNRLAQDDKSNIDIPGIIFQFLWNICITVSRIIAISILASQWPIYTICGCFVHWFFMTLWLIVEPLGISEFCGSSDRGAGEPLSLKEKIRSWLFAAVLGFVYIFIHLNPGENKTFLRHLFYFSLCGIENLVAVIIWAMLSDQSVKNSWYFEILIILTVVTFILGTISMIIYYECLHPNLNRNDSSSQRMRKIAYCCIVVSGCLSVYVMCAILLHCFIEYHLHA